MTNSSCWDCEIPLLMNWYNLCAVKENASQRNSAFLRWRMAMVIQTTYGRRCCELEKPLCDYLQRQSKKSIFHNVQLTLQKSNLNFVQRKSFSYRKSNNFKHSATNEEFLEEHPEETRSQVRFVSIAGRSGGQVSCTDGLKSIQQETSFQALRIQHHAQRIAEVSSVLVQNRFGDRSAGCNLK